MAQRAAQAVRPVRAEEHAAAIAVLTKSFADSPFGLWLYPDDAAAAEREFTALFASYLAKPAAVVHRLGLIGEAPATLWTPAEGLVPFYGRFGFELRSRHDVDGASAFWMTRGGAARG